MAVSVMGVQEQVRLTPQFRVISTTSVEIRSALGWLIQCHRSGE